MSSYFDAENKFMRAALLLAEEAAREGEVPVGAVVVKDGEVISGGRNRREGSQNALTHAEIEAIDGACKRLGSWRLLDCDMYVTLEPCPMCAGAIINSRIKRLFYGASDAKAGCHGSVTDLFSLPFNHRVEVTGGVMQEECSHALSGFFAALRESKKTKAKD